MTGFSISLRSLAALVFEGRAIARSQPVGTLVAAMIVAAVCGVILATVGQTAATEAQIVGRIDEAGARTIVVSDPTGEGQLFADSVASIQALDGVDWAIGLGPAIDVRNPDLGLAGAPVPLRRLYGEIPSTIRVVEGRPPSVGESLAGNNALATLGAGQPAVGMRGQEFSGAVVGRFSAEQPLAFLDRSLLLASTIAGKNGTTIATVRDIYVVVTTIEGVEPIARAVRAVVHSGSPASLSVETPHLLAELHAVIGSDLSAAGRRLLAVMLVVGMLVVALTIGGAVSLRRRDFGRRRALGATRSAIVVLVLVQAGFAALLGLAVGITVGLVVVWRLAGSLPPVEFVTGVGSLCFLMALMAGIPPGLMAAFRDPVRILRVP